MRALLLLLSAALAQAAVDGTVVNKTTGNPQPGATVTLYKLGGAGMESIESVTSGAGGRFTINQDAKGPHMIQTGWAGVQYSHMLPEGSPGTGITIEIFDSSPQAGAAKVSTHMILFEPQEGQLTVNESFVMQNPGNTAFHNPKDGTLRFFLPEAAGGKVKVTATAPQGMPVERIAEKTAQAGLYAVDFAVKPGETRFDLTYTLPYSPPAVFATRVAQKDTPTRIVVPAGVTAKGEGLQLLGQEPSTQASIYETKERAIQVELAGTGSLGESSAPEEGEGGGLQQIRPAVYERLGWILGLSALILLAGFLLLYRKASPVASQGAVAAARGAGKPDTKRGKRRG